MSKIYYKNTDRRKRLIRNTGFALCLVGFLGFLYVFFPFLSWQIYFAPAFAAQNVTAPIPQVSVLNSATLSSLIAESAKSFVGVDYSNAHNWFPDIKAGKGKAGVPEYLLSIPTLGIKNATVSTQDYDLSAHLINYIGTAVPPDKGTAVILGHSTLPQLFDPKNYNAIFATAYKLKIGDELFTTVNGIVYTYKIFSITVVDPSDTSVFFQHFDNSYITLVTCTPPGTTWKRLIIKSQLQTL